MKIEQACRFRMDEGYCIFAKSPNLTPAQEEALGNAFNGAMNTIFPTTGSSILSCTPGRTDAFFAKNTLRTDVLGRKTIFTHTYVIHSEEYADIMENAPMTLLGIPMSQMLDSQASGAQLDELTLEKQPLTNEMLDVLFQKYDLTPERYGKLLMGAYEAMTSNGSLQLKTKLPIEQTELLVREMTCCILAGLLPVLKGRVSFSSGADTRMNISVLSSSDTAAQPAQIVFGVEDDSFTNIRPKDEVCAIAFEALGKATHEQRRQTLLDMEAWLSEVTNIQEGLSLMLISLAYCLCQEQTMSPEMLLMLFRNVRTAGKGFSNRVTNSLLTELVRKLNAQNYCTANALSQIAGWYLRESTPQFREEADRTFAMAAQDVCAALVEAAFKQEMTENTGYMLQALLRQVAPENSPLPVPVQEKIVLWILHENVETFIDYAKVLADNFSDAQMLALVRGILENSTDDSLTSAEMAMLSQALLRAAASGQLLSEQECSHLDVLCARHGEPLTAAGMEYLFAVRLPALDTEAGVRLFEYLHDSQKALLDQIEAQILAGRYRGGEIWESYQAQHCFYDGIGWADIKLVCQECNTFLSADGAFEKKAAEAVVAVVKLSMESPGYEKATLQYFCEVFLPRNLAALQMLNLSVAAKENIKKQILETFWDRLSYEQVYLVDVDIPKEYVVRTASSQLKIFLCQVIMRLKKDPGDASTLIAAMDGATISEETKQELSTRLELVIYRLLNDKKYLSWDLVLLACRKNTEKGTTVDTKQLLELCAKIDIVEARLRSEDGQFAELVNDPGDSALLQDEKLRKTVLHAGGKTPACLQVVIDHFKSSQKGFFSGLFERDEAPEKRPRREESFDEEPEERRAKRSQGRFFDDSEPEKAPKRGLFGKKDDGGGSPFKKKRG